jgi:hypothetical protein
MAEENVQGSEVDTSTSGDVSQTQEQSDNQAVDESGKTQEVSAQDAIQAKLQGVELGETKTDQDSGKSPADATAKPGAKTAEQPKLDPDLVRFAQAKGYDLGEIEKSRSLQTSVKAQRESEAEMNRLREEVRKIKDGESGKAAETVVNAPKPGDKEKPRELSPVESLNQRYEAILNDLLLLHGVPDEATLAQSFPDAYSRVKAMFERDYRAALAEEPKFHFSQANKSTEEKAARQKLEEEYNSVKSTYQNNILEQKKIDPAIESNLLTSGVMEHVQGLAGLLKIPTEYLLADKNLFGFFAKAAAAIQKASNFTKDIEKEKQKWEKDREKASKANLPSTDRPLPQDERARIAISTSNYGRGVSMRN